ncbi:hypothetical protein HYFRA_00002625 [Hymenoscyphus fraxineus]|uniref:Uncharacterized protein n=1 Tax=Hymenoscyphus fraxineus TaxID=746836 RepID=A0A9N9LAM0_9HELO|nr:hypothetical protein HYFRA_00002625 [Hymenoscyphus fraxineus]
MPPPNPTGRDPVQRALYSTVAARSLTSTPSDRSTGLRHIEEVRHTIHQLEIMQQEHEDELRGQAVQDLQATMGAEDADGEGNEFEEFEESFEPAQENSGVDDSYLGSGVYTQLNPRPQKRKVSTASLEHKQEEGDDMTEIDDDLTNPAEDDERDAHEWEERSEELLQRSYPTIGTTRSRAEYNRRIRDAFMQATADSNGGEGPSRQAAPSPETHMSAAEETESTRGAFSCMVDEAERDLIQNQPIAEGRDSPRWQPRRQMSLEEMTHAELWQYQNWLMIELANVNRSMGQRLDDSLMYTSHYKEALDRMSKPY